MSTALDNIDGDFLTSALLRRTVSIINNAPKLHARCMIVAHMSTSSPKSYLAPCIVTLTFFSQHLTYLLSDYFLQIRTPPVHPVHPSAFLVSIFMTLIFRFILQLGNPFVAHLNSTEYALVKRESINRRERKDHVMYNT